MRRIVIGCLLAVILAPVSIGATRRRAAPSKPATPATGGDCHTFGLVAAGTKGTYLTTTSNGNVNFTITWISDTPTQTKTTQHVVTPQATTDVETTLDGVVSGPLRGIKHLYTKSTTPVPFLGNTVVEVDIDFVPSLLERARQRAAVERLEATFQDGDAEHIPFVDASFDVVLSTFGVMFAPDQQQAASEILRVCRGGGKIGLANWTPESFVGQIERVAAAYRPPPTAGLRSPILWGLEPHVRELLGEKVRSVRAQKRVCLFRARSVQHWLEFNITYLGHAKRTLESLDPTMQERLLRGMTDVARHFNRSGDDTFVAASEYLEVVAIRG